MTQAFEGVNRIPHQPRQAPVAAASRARRIGPKPEIMLFPGHRQQLVEESGIAEPIIDARGYRSLTRQAAPAVLKELGFNPTQCRLGAGLLIPVLGIDGTPVLHQFRPDHPRQNHQGKAIKYESPSKARSVVRLWVPS
jgi:hypothetical protein